LLQYLRRREQGQLHESPAPWDKHTVTSKQFALLVQEIDKDQTLKGYWEEKVRYDWDEEYKELVFRMPTALHESFIGEFEAEILNRLRVLREAASTTPAAKAELSRIRPGRSPTLKLLPMESSDSETAGREGVGRSSTQTRRCPDSTFFTKQAESPYPVAVLEVSYSQKRKDLVNLADQYITASAGGIKVVLGFDIEYKGTKEATVSVWRPKISSRMGELVGTAEAVLDTIPFRTRDGEPVAGSLDLLFTDFGLENLDRTTAPAEVIPAQFDGAVDSSVTSDVLFNIPFSKLNTILAEAEESHALVNASFEAPASSSGIKWTKRKRTPTPPLDDEREEQFRQAEERGVILGDLGDADYEPARRRQRRRV